jgi:phage tail sheath gpL-like
MMTIPSGTRTPGVYVGYNTDTIRVGLPANNQKILFITEDVYLAGQEQTVPKPLYDSATAKTLYGDDSDTARMINAALKVASFVDVQSLGKL